MIKLPTKWAFYLAAVVSAAMGLTACNSQNGPAPLAALPAESQLAALPMGDIAGAAKVQASNQIANPLQGNLASAEQGHQLFIAMNCAGCHGYDAKGGMGPNLTDAFWRYGGMPSSIYNSIVEGRPQGMPSWGKALPPQDIWKLVSFIQSLGGTVDPKDYHQGLQGDHDVTTIAPEAKSLVGVFDQPLGQKATGQDLAPEVTRPAPPYTR